MTLRNKKRCISPDSSGSEDDDKDSDERDAHDRKNSKKTLSKKVKSHEDGRKNPSLPLLHCYICQKSYTKAYPLSKHLDEHYSNRKVTHENPCPCSQCGKIFTTQKFLECHKICHKVEKLYDCRVCSRRFSTAKILRLHREYHAKEKKYNCEVCSESFRFQNAFIIHVEKHIERLPLPQELLDLHVIPAIDDSCQAPPGVNQDLMNGGILYKCSQCPQKFATVNERRNHQSREHPKIHTCEYCGKELRSSFSYRLHLVSHTKEKTFKCKLCGEAFAYPNLLVVHRRVAHGTGDPEKLLRPYRCEPCGKAYVFKYALTEHINFVHRDLKLICDLCGYSYGTKARLRRHFKRVHLRTKVNEKQRATCARIVGSKAEIGKERKCPECDFLAYRMAELRTHRIESHFNGLHCDECNVTMNSILTYRQHAEDHKDGISVVPGPGRHGKIFGCISCDKFYTDRRFLRDHINARHKSIIFKCDHCDMTFQTKRYLVRHLSLHHGITNKEPMPKKVEGMKKKAPKKMKIKNIQSPEMQSLPPHISHQSLTSSVQEYKVLAQTSVQSIEGQQHFKRESKTESISIPSQTHIVSSIVSPGHEMQQLRMLTPVSMQPTSTVSLGGQQYFKGEANEQALQYVHFGNIG
ncbi:zinc finger protein 99-like isoform X2 [Phlebotomus argentipes]|nr:zinc finger protein 99-like isoform X2 [Phlebotomus argentipes]